MALLNIEGLHAGYGKFLVLKGVDVTVPEGDIVCVIGPNGAGKSTLFRAVYGLITPTEGDIQFRGTSIVGDTQAELLRKGISYILQRDAVFPKMTVRENLEMGAYIADGNYNLNGKIDEMYEMFPILRERSKNKAGDLSGGERQMLEFARGLMLDPELLLIDEPTAGLAPKIIDQVFQHIQRINESGVTIFMIEQNIKTALKYADNAYVLENGQNRFHGSAESILDNPEIRQAYLGETVQYD